MGLGVIFRLIGRTSRLDIQVARLHKKLLVGARLVDYLMSEPSIIS